VVRLALAGLILAGAICWIVLAGPSEPLPVPVARPAASYDEALARFAAIARRDGTEVNPVCHSLLLTHGYRTTRAVVLLHGFTNCPRQFAPLARIFYDRGANVLVPRIPRHGLRDRMTDELSRLTRSEMIGAGAEAVDAAHGLGDTVIVVGLSSTAVVAGALAEQRTDVGRAVLLAPALAPKGFTPELARRLATLLIHIPNQFIWWDSKEKEALGGPKQCYPRFSTHALGKIYRMGSLVLLDAERRPPAVKSIAVVTSAEDGAVANGPIATLAQRWRSHGAAVREYQFADSLHVLHDMIDPEQVGARVERVYPILTALALGAPLP
jgi:pimeloyl-ACP methyl ester carboxylesterase